MDLRGEMIILELKTFLVIIVVCFLLSNFLNNFFSYSFSVSPSYTRQNIKDSALDWIDIGNQSNSYKGDPSTDISEVTYNSDGRFLNTTIWLLFPFKVTPVNYESFNYGIMIDSDFNNNTGTSGIDYQLEIRWNKTAKNWDRVLTEWSSAVGGKVLDQTRNFAAFSKNQSYYVFLSLNLDKILNPEKFRAIFYAESRLPNGHLVTDFTKWVIIPPPNVQILGSPSSVTMKQGEKRTIELVINSTPTLEPDIRLNSSNYQHSDLDLHFSTPALKVPSDGMATIPLTIGTSEKTAVAPHTVFIFANASFPSLEFLKLAKPTKNVSGSTLNLLEIGSEDVITRSSLLINVEQATSLIDQVGDFWNKLGGPISFIYGIAAGLSPWLFTTIKNRLTKNERDKKD